MAANFAAILSTEGPSCPRLNAKSTGKGGLVYRISSFLDNSKQKEDTWALLSNIVIKLCHASRYKSRKYDTLSRNSFD
jgi:hypothetical protein